MLCTVKDANISQVAISHLSDLQIVPLVHQVSLVFSFILQLNYNVVCMWCMHNLLWLVQALPTMLSSNKTNSNVFIN